MAFPLCHCGADVSVGFAQSDHVANEIAQMRLRLGCGERFVADEYCFDDLLSQMPAAVQHGAKTFADPAGEASISGTERLTRYRFGQATADFLLCSRCGVYVAAVIEHEGRHFATINAAGLQIPLLATRSATPVSYEGEDAEARRQRRLDRWMPVVLNEDRGAARA